MQILARSQPFYLVDLLLEKSKTYHETNRSNYWNDLLATEKNGERYLSEFGDVNCLVPFAPLRGLNEVQAVVKGKSNLKELNEEDWRGLAQGIVRALRFYHSQGYVSFNAVLMSGPLDEHLDYFDVNLRMISRAGVQQSCFTDAWAAPYLLWDGEAVEIPERFAEKLRPNFQKTTP
jgi:galactose-1-phosphate uridylyltransferase